MKDTRQKSTYLITLFIVFQYLSGFSAENSIPVLISDKFNINFVGSISKTEDIIQNESLFNKFWDILVGGEDQNLVKPFSVFSTGSGTLYVLDQGASKIQKYDLRANSSSTFHFPEHVSLVGMTMLRDSSIIFSDSRNNGVYKLNPDGDSATPFVTDRILNQPTGLACNPVTGNVWISETAAHRLSVFDPNGNFIRNFGGRGTGPGQFNYPTYILINQNQIVYVVDALNNRIQILDSLGNVISNFGQTGDGSGDLARPKGIACDSYGHIYIVDGLFHNVQIFDKHGKFLANFGQQGQQPGNFWMPAGIFIDNKNKIYVADTYNARIQIFELEVTH
jgi:DNA-binding beta-propeller fold protein YncE